MWPHSCQQRLWWGKDISNNTKFVVLCKRLPYQDALYMHDRQRVSRVFSSSNPFGSSYIWIWLQSQSERCSLDLADKSTKLLVFVKEWYLWWYAVIAHFFWERCWLKLCVLDSVYKIKVLVLVYCSGERQGMIFLFIMVNNITKLRTWRLNLGNMANVCKSLTLYSSTVSGIIVCCLYHYYV